MQNDLLKFRKGLTSFTCFSLILISNNSELAAKYITNKDMSLYKNNINLQDIIQDENNVRSLFNSNKENNLLIADNGEKFDAFDWRRKKIR